MGVTAKVERSLVPQSGVRSTGYGGADAEVRTVGDVGSARAQQCLRTARIRLIDEKVSGLVGRVVQVVDPIVF